MASDNITTEDLNVPDLGEMINTRASLSAAFDRNPDQAAQALKLSQSTGTPVAAVEDNLQYVGNLQKLDDYSRMLQNAPKTRQFFAKPDQAAVGHDNLPNMHAIERTFLDRETDILRSDMPPMSKIGSMFQEMWPDRVLSNWYSGKENLAKAISQSGFMQGLQRQQAQAMRANGIEPTPGLDTAVYVNDLRRRAARYPRSDETELTMQVVQSAPDYSTAAKAFMRHPSALGDVILESFGASAPALAMTAGGAMVGGPLGAAAGAFSGSLLTEYGASLSGYLDEHNIDSNDPLQLARALNNPELMAEARTYATERGIPVAVFDALGAYLGGKFIAGAKSTSLKAMAPRIAAEPLVNAATGAAGEQTAQWVTGENKPGDVIAEALAELPTALVEIPGNYRHALRYADQAEQDAQRIETLNKLAASDKVLQRDTALFQNFARDASEDGPTNQVFISAGALMQSGNAEQLMAASPSIAAQLPQAQTDPGKLIAIPTDEYLAKIAPTDYAQPLIDHLKFDPDGFTRAEAEEFKTKHIDEMTQEFARAIGNKTQDQEFQASHDRLEQKFREELNAVGKHPDSVNKAYAKMLAAYFSVAAGKRNVLPEKMHNEYAVKFAQGQMAQQGYEQIQQQGVLNTLNPTGTVFTDYTPEVRASAPLGENMTTLDKTSGGNADDLVTVYRGGAEGSIAAGDFVTTNEQLAKDYAGTGKVASLQVKKGDILDDLSDPLGEEYIYRPGASSEILRQRSNILYQSAPEGGANAITGDLERVNPDVRDAVENRIARLPEEDQQRVRDNLEKYKGTAWAAAAVKGMAYREMLDRAMAGEDISNLERNPIWGKQDMSATKLIQAFKKYPSHGERVLKLLLNAYDFIGGNRKAENDISTSFANCDPSKACAVHCYAAGSNARPNEIAKSEFTEFMIEHFPMEMADKIASDYLATEAGKSGLSLRLNDKGDLSPAQVKLIELLNDKGIAVQVFSKRPELLRSLSDVNLKMLSVDGTNMDVAAANPDLRLAVTITDEMTEAMLAPLQDRVSVYLPVNLKGKAVTAEELKSRFPNLYSRMRKENLCPVDGGKLITKPGTSFVDIRDKTADKGVWTCTACDLYGNAGCFKGDRQTNQRKAQTIMVSDLTRELEVKKVRKDLQANLETLLQLGGIDGELYSQLSQALSSGQRAILEIADTERATRGTESASGTTEEGAGSGSGTGRDTGGAYNQGNRGAFNPESLTIAYLEDADYSTFIHETGHFFLEMHFDMASKLQKMADDLGMDTLTPGEQEILRDVQSILDWFGIPDLNTWYSLDLEQKRPYHERFARGFERYTFEGKSPSIELHAVFKKFAAWLKAVYKSITQFGDVKLTDEVRGVFDRMLASEEQINLVQQARGMLPLLTSIDQAPMSVDDFDRYQKENSNAVDEAVEELTRRTLNDMRWLRNARSKALKDLQRDSREIRKDVRLQVKAEVMSTPLYRAWTLLTSKIKPEDRVIPPNIKRDPNVVQPEIDSLFTAIAKLGGLNKQEVVSTWGTDPAYKPNSSVFGKPVWRVEGGLSIDGMVEALSEHGYLNVDEHGKADIRELEELFDEELRGKPQYAFAHDYAHLDEQRAGDHIVNPAALSAVRFDPGELSVLGISHDVIDILKKRRMTLQTGGLHPDIVRDLILDENAQPAFASGEALARALAEATPPNEAIEALTDVRMLEEHGDIATPEALEAAADLAVHNKARIKFAVTQANTLATATGQRRVLQTAAQELADHEIGRTKVRYLRPSRYTAVEAKAAKSAADYVKAGDLPNAAAEARNQVFNMMAAKAALAARDEVRKIDLFFKRVVSGKDDVVGKTRDMDIVNAARAVLYRFGYGHKAKKADEYLKAVEKYDPALYLVLQQSVAMADALANSVNASGPVTLKDMTVDQVRALNDEIELLWYQARRGKEVEVDGKMVNKETVVEAIADQADSLDTVRVDYGKAHAITPDEERALNIASAKAIGRRVEFWVDMMDNGGKMGPFRFYLFNRIKDAADAFRTENAAKLRAFRDLFDTIAPSFKRGLIDAWEFGYTFGHAEGGVAMNELLHAILHTGNESNKRKLLLGRGWASEREDGTVDTAHWDAFIARLIDEGVLTKAHFDFAQGVWDLLESTKEKAQKAHREAYGRYFAEVTATPFSTPWGEYRGGYIPATVDSRLVKDQELKKLIEEGKDGMAYAFPGTNKGFTMSRVEYNRPLMLDLRTLPQHINKVLLFSHMEMPVRDVQRVISDKRVRNAVDGIDPAAINVMLLPWLNRSARQQVTTPVAGASWVNRFANMLRGRTVMSTMFLNVTNAAQQITGFFPAALQVKPGLMADAAAEYFKDSRAMVDEIAAMSPFMAHRMDNEISAMMDDINQILLNPTVLEKAQEWSKRHSFFLQSAVDNVMAPIIWRAAFNQALAEEFDVKNAIRIADSVVRTTQGSSLPEDVSRFETGPAWARVLTLFSGWFINLANLMGGEFGKIMQQGGLRKNAGRAFMVFTLAFYAQALVAEAISLAMRGGPDDDDKDGTYLDDWAKTIFVFGPIRTATAMVPVIGPAVNSMAARFNHNPNDDRISVSPVVNAIEAGAGVPFDLYELMATEKGNARQTIRDVGTLITLRYGIAVAPAVKALGYAGGVAQGKINPTGPVDVARGLVTGVPSPESKQR